MPSVSAKQAKLMSAIDHGWQPPASMKHAPSQAVAREFHEADKRKGEFMHAEGGSINDAPATDSVLKMVAAGADRATSFDPHRTLSRVAAALASQAAGLSPEGNPQFGKTPGVVKETMALPTLLDLPASVAMNPDNHGPTSLFSPILHYLQNKYGDYVPSWSRKASDEADQLHEATRKAMNLTPPKGALEHGADALGTMLGQVPIPATEVKTGAGVLKSIASALPEYLGPTVRPSVGNYLKGALAGGVMGRIGDAPDKTDVQMAGRFE